MNLHEQIATELHRHAPRYPDFACECGFLLRVDPERTPERVHDLHRADAVLGVLRDAITEKNQQMVTAARRDFRRSRTTSPPAAQVQSALSAALAVLLDDEGTQ